MSQPQDKEEGQISLDERIERYLKKLAGLKERASLRDVQEREMLLEFITANHDRINEYPLLETQRNGLINILCYRSQGHPANEFLKRYISNFLHILTRYSKADSQRDSEGVKQLRTQIANTEVILIKCVQGAVYASSLIHDNMEEILITYFGEKAIAEVESFTEKLEPGERYWREMLSHFVTRPVEMAFEQILSEERYSLFKEQNYLFIQFPFDAVLSGLKQTSKNIQKTRVQNAYEEETAGEESLSGFRLAQEVLRRETEVLGRALERHDMLHISRIVCMDAVCEQYREKLERFQNESPDEQRQAELDFIREQLVSMAVGILLVLDTMREEFLLSLSRIDHQDSASVTHLLGVFDAPSLNKTFFTMLLGSFTGLLQEKKRDEGNKVIVKTNTVRRLPVEKLRELQQNGLTKIGRSKLFEQDSASTEHCLFRPKNGRDLESLLQMLQLSDELRESIDSLWENSGWKVDVLVAINLNQLARTTTNLKARLAEILGKFGVSPGG
ncbi:hypothetical protein [Desulfohalovibrio reitneri]|uniref:hypothetical protein n=1 Tax=Desulfohalovibrio reitneri TaxID=1307759 RepID=UPI0004A7120B|nr:hypothetical protein [Desulfohalovibrio reitneri]